jgi:hypothetical protein
MPVAAWAGWVRRTRSEHVLIGAIAIALYWLGAVLTKHTTTPDTAYFNQLADAFLHGRLHLGTPTVTHDLTQHNGNWYVPFPPLAAIMMMPFVAVVGLARMNTVVFAAVVGGFNVALMSRLMARLSHWASLLFRNRFAAGSSSLMQLARFISTWRRRARFGSWLIWRRLFLYLAR